MKTYYENYGADADGNRGVKTLMYELEDTPDERIEIAELLIFEGYTPEDTGSVGLEYDGVNIEVSIEDYKTEMQVLEEGS